MLDLTASQPKPMIEICGKPMLEHILVALREAGIREFVLVTGYRAEIVENYFKDGSRLGVKIDYIRQQFQNGTGAAFHLAKDFMAGESFFAGFGDIITALPNYSRLILDFYRQPCDALVSLNWVEDPYRGAVVYLNEEDGVTDIIEKPRKGTSTSHWNNAGLMVFSPVLFEYTAQLKPSARGEYEITTAIQAMIVDRRPVRGFKLEGFCGDVGRPEDIEPAIRAICGVSNRQPDFNPD
jgi:dTDP-glucose pyrophosphorylase